ncbi:hypothetical protein HK100_004289 [Physocladia obscura]|uniref:FAD/NAD(P)-binding domain-containing protein n=1 Tax=Physocladia obscura TaxID=109957 RepID=A0AAD5SVZ2_9FUNG|nr:hypothetical protein HK100_004289 [Physocladia obscura]
MTPLLDPSKIHDIWLPFTERSKLFSPIPQENLIQGSAVKLNSNALELHDGRKIPFDFAVVATGTKSSLKSTAWTKSQGLQDAEELCAALKKASNIAIVGGGQVGVELAAKLCSELPNTHVDLLHRSSTLLSKMAGMNDAARKKILAVLQQFPNITIRLQDTIVNSDIPRKDISFERCLLHTQSGNQINADVTILTTGNIPNSKFVADGLGKSVLDQNGYVRTNPDGSVEGFPHIFSAGDISTLDSVKLAHQAVNQAEIVSKNISVLIEAGYFGQNDIQVGKLKLQKYSPAQKWLARVNLGQLGSVMKIWFLVIHSKK